VPAAGITLERTALTLDSDASGAFTLSGEAHSGPGSITLDGSGHFAPERWSARVSATGEDFEAVKLIPVQALVSPQITIDADPSRIAIGGGVHVPRAAVTIKALAPDVVSVSNDEIIVGRAPPATAQWRRRLRVALDVTLGEEVRVSAFGLDTGLSGGLALGVDGAAPATARGTVTLVGGRFTAYGQDLAIRRGRLLFAGPMDNPGLDFEAVRDAGEVKAGIEVSGAQMHSRVFSEPSLPQAEALAWLLTGRGLSGASSSDGATLAGAAVALGLEGSDQVTREIGTSLGLDELSVAPGTGLEDSALVLGKSLSPQLYIRYALGLLGQQGTVELEYKVTDSVSVEAESGARYGADVIYKLER
jgi:translocation and assembly module TamB